MKSTLLRETSSATTAASGTLGAVACMTTSRPPFMETICTSEPFQSPNLTMGGSCKPSTIPGASTVTRQSDVVCAGARRGLTVVEEVSTAVSLIEVTNSRPAPAALKWLMFTAKSGTVSAWIWKRTVSRNSVERRRRVAESASQAALARANDSMVTASCVKFEPIDVATAERNASWAV